jgi:flagellar basal body P-ring formation protein FlgA
LRTALRNRIGTMRQMPRIAAVLAVVAVFCSPALAAGSITVKSRADVAGSNILVGELAVISGVSESEKDRISKLTLGLAPPPNADYKFNAAQVKGRLYKAGLDVNGYQLNIPDKVIVHRKATIVTGKQLVEAGIEFLKENMQDEQNLTFEAKNAPLTIVLPYGEVKYEFTMESRPKRYGVQNFIGKVYMNGELKRTVTLTSYVRVMADVVAAAKDMEVGHVLLDEDLTVQKMDLVKLRPGAYGSIDAAIGKKTIRALRSGDILTHSVVEDVADIISGDTVTLVFSGGGFDITAQGKALEKGYKGDSIRVVIDSSRKVVDGIVIDSKTVEVTGK